MPAIDISNNPVFSLGTASDTEASWSNTDIAYEWALNGVPFLSIASDEFQSIRSFVQVNKQQFDSSRDAGEQTLTGWWLRSQRDFSSGSGLEFLEPVTDERTMRRFKESFGVDVWTPGRVSLLKATAEPSGFTSTGACRVVSAGSYVYMSSGSTTLRRFDGSTVSSLTLANTPVWLASNGSVVFAFSSGAIERQDSSGSSAPTVAYTGSGITRGWWVKGRLLVAAGTSLHWAADNTGASTSLPSALSIGSVPAGWTWTSAAEIPSGILVGGYAGSRSQIYRLESVDTNAGSVSTIRVVADLPAGEQVLCLYGYLGSYVAIGTNKGLRIGIVSDNGTVTYGPLTYSAAPVEHVVGKDRFLFCGVTNAIDGKSGVIRVDLSDSDEAGRFAWANDLTTGVTGTVDGVTVLGATDRVCIGINSDGTYVESATELVASGSLTTAQVRYSTLESKNFQLASIRADTSAGSVNVLSVTGAGVETLLHTVSGTVTQTDIGVHPSAPAESMGLKFTLNRGSSTTGPVLRGWQFKALPAVTRKQQWRLPLLSFDMEIDRYGNRFGFPGRGLSRYQSLRSSLVNGSPVLLQDLVANEAYMVIIEDIQFVQTTPPKQVSGFGGVLVVQAREL